MQRNSCFGRSVIKVKLIHGIFPFSCQFQLGKMRLTIPCRAITCSHLQCFDATLYIQMNEKKPTWVCPVCDKKAPYEHLIIDGWVQRGVAPLESHCCLPAAMFHLCLPGWPAVTFSAGCSWKSWIAVQTVTKSSSKRMGIGPPWG